MSSFPLRKEASVRVMRCVIGVVVAAAALVGGLGCETNQWKSGYIASGDGVYAPTAFVEIEGRPFEEVRGLETPAGSTRVGFSDFVSDSPPSMVQLREFAQEIGATRVVWGRGFADLSTEIEYRTEPSFESSSGYATVERDGRKERIRVDTTRNDWDQVPYSRTKTWYRYLVYFFRDDAAANSASMTPPAGN